MYTLVFSLEDRYATFFSNRIDCYIHHLFLKHPEWFDNSQTFTIEFANISPSILNKETAYLFKDKAIALQTDEHDQHYNVCGMLSPIASDYLRFQFSDDKDCITECTVERPYAPIHITNRTIPFMYKRWTLTFASREHMMLFSKQYAEYQITSTAPIFTESVKIFMNDNDTWNRSDCKTIPTMDSIFINKDTKQSIIKKIDSFISLKSRAEKFGKPHKLNILLHGVPGSGKTSIVKALANHYKRRLYLLSFSKDMKDSNMNTLLKTIRDESILVLEDIDSFFVQRESKCNVSFSCLLNTLDGVGNCDRSLITILTANHPEALDAALLRPGRIDMLVKFDYPEKEEVFAAFSAYSELPVKTETKGLPADTVTKEFNKFYKHIKGLKLPMSLITDYLFHHQYDYIESIHELLNHHDSLKEILKDKSEKMYL